MKDKSSLKEQLTERLDLKTNESLMKIGEFVARIFGFRSMFVGGPFGGQKSAVFVIQVPDDATQNSVKSIVQSAADLKTGSAKPSTSSSTSPQRRSFLMMIPRSL